MGSKVPKPRRSINETKTIEMKSWSGSTEFGLAPSSTSERYDIEQDSFLLNRSVQSLDLHNKTIINVGGGHGKEAEFLLKKGAKTVALVDIATAQLLSAKNRQKKHKLEGLELVQADAEHLPFKPESFDLGYVYLALHHFPDHHRSISEISTVVKEGVIFVDIMSPLITKLLTCLGFCTKEWCGTEPHRLKGKEIKLIFHQLGINSNVKYFFAPPFLSFKNTWILRIIKYSSIVLNYVMLVHPKIARIFGNVGLIVGEKVDNNLKAGNP